MEPWFAFELAAKLDPLLDEHGWIALVERERFDLLLVPQEKTDRRHRLFTNVKTWPEDIIAVELKTAHLCDGPKSRMHALVDDLTKKPGRAREEGHPCAMFFGVLVTTSGLWTTFDSPVVKATKERAAAMPEPALGDGLKVVAVVDRAVQYKDWVGHVWVEIVESALG